ncbi:MAG: RNA pseudouridine synthase, partial [Alistipes sp.]|nr:RNA pseudouridine synthase [Alistipes sp.]
ENGHSRVRFYPLTGRTHQLRVHSAHKDGLGVPIMGDDIYGIPEKRLYLHAETLEFTHPRTGERIKIECRAEF